VSSSSVWLEVDSELDASRLPFNRCSKYPSVGNAASGETGGPEKQKPHRYQLWGFVKPHKDELAQLLSKCRGGSPFQGLYLAASGTRESGHPRQNKDTKRLLECYDEKHKKVIKLSGNLYYLVLACSFLFLLTRSASASAGMGVSASGCRAIAVSIAWAKKSCSLKLPGIWCSI
jgi:hypothetical protein